MSSRPSTSRRGSAFNNVFSNTATFLAVAQTFEDTGGRAKKGQAGNAVCTATVLYRRVLARSTPWRRTTLRRSAASAAVSEAFIEPLTREQVVAIVTPFVV